MENSKIDPQLAERIARFVQKNRDRCLWFLRDNSTPTTVDAALRVFGYIRRYGDRNAWVEAKELEECLLPNSR